MKKIIVVIVAYLAILSSVLRPCFGATVHFKDPKRKPLKGKVVDIGDSIKIEVTRGDNTVVLTISKHKIEKIVLDETDTPPKMEPQDMIVLKNGETHKGKVTVKGDSVELEKTKDGKVFKMSFNKDAVRKVIKGRDRVDLSREEKLGIHNLPTVGRIKRLVDLLEDRDKRKLAKEELINIGFLAVPYLEGAKEHKDKDTKREILEILKTLEWSQVVTSEMKEGIKDIFERLSNSDTKVRLDVLREIAIEYPSDSKLLLLKILNNEKEDTTLRSYAVRKLIALGYTDELIGMFQKAKKEKGPQLLAIAIALGDNEYYAVSVPYVIGVLRHDDKRLQEVAIDRLKTWTNKYFGFLPTDDKKRKEEAIQRWEKWWEDNGRAFVREFIPTPPDMVSEENKEIAKKLWQEGNKYLDQEKFLEAISCFRKALDYNPAFIIVRIELGKLLKLKGMLHLAEKHLNIAVKHYAHLTDDIKLKECYLLLGEISRELKKWDEARQYYNLAIALDPALCEAINGLGKVYFARGIFEENDKYLNIAKEKYLKVLQMNKFNAEAHYNLAEFYAIEREWKMSIAEFKEAVKQDPDNVVYWNNFALVYEESGNLDDAIKLYEKCVALDPSFKLAKLNLQRALEKKSKKPKIKQ